MQSFFKENSKLPKLLRMLLPLIYPPSIMILSAVQLKTLAAMRTPLNPKTVFIATLSAKILQPALLI